MIGVSEQIKQHEHFVLGVWCCSSRELRKELKATHLAKFGGSIGTANTSSQSRQYWFIRAATIVHRRHTNSSRQNDPSTAQGLHTADAQILHWAWETRLGSGNDKTRVVAE